MRDRYDPQRRLLDRGTGNVRDSGLSHHSFEPTHSPASSKATTRLADFNIQSSLRGQLPQTLLTEKGGWLKLDHALQALRTDHLIDYDTFIETKERVRQYVNNISLYSISPNGTEDSVVDVFHGESYGAVADALNDLKEITANNARIAITLPLDKADILWRAQDALQEAFKRMTMRKVPPKFALTNFTGAA